MSPIVRVAVLGIGLVLGIVGEWTFAQYVPTGIAALDTLEYAAYLVVGVIVWSRRPEDRTGPLLVATAYAFILQNMSATGAFITDNFGPTGLPLLAFVGLWTQGLSDVLRYQVLFGYPGGRIRHLLDRVALAAGYLLIVGHGFWLATTWHASTGVVLFYPRYTTYELNTQIRAAVALLLLLIASGILIGRWIKGSYSYRRVMGPVLFAGLLPGEIILILFGAAAFTPFDVSPGLVQASTVISYVAEILVPLALGFGMLRTRVIRGTVGDLVVDLSGPMPPGGLRAALARTLRDPSLEVVFHVPGAGWLASSGAYVELPTGGSGRAVTVLQGEDGPVAALLHDPALLEERELVEAAGAAARLALENERLHAEVLAQLEQVRASRARIVEAADTERRRVERDLHDGAQQRLVTLSLALRQAQEGLDGADPRVAATLQEAAGELRLALSELRELARGIHPVILTEEGLVAAVESLAERSPLPVEVSGEGVGRLPVSVEATGYFVVSEALANVAKHAQASRGKVSLIQIDGVLTVAVSDDGVGGADQTAGSGLRGIEDRVAALGGTLTMHSPLGGGTTVRAVIPCGEGR